MTESETADPSSLSPSKMKDGHDNHTSNKDNSDVIPQPYSVWRNPNLGWTDALVAYVMSRMIAFKDLDNETLDPHSEEAATIVQKIRKQMHDLSFGLIGRMSVKKWSQAAGGVPLAEYSGTIPFQKDILTKWGVVSKTELDASLPDCSREQVPILVRFPSTLLSAKERENATTLDYSGCLQVKELDLANFALNVPFLVQFHGGGMVLGEAHMLTLLDETAELVAAYSKEHKESDPPAIVTISVDYGLAPEHPFPVAIMDALSVVEYLLKGNASRCLHLSGESAGANISMVTGLEAFRKYPGRILSIQSQGPMLDPAGDSLCYYMNQDKFLESNFVRWCWRAYLDLKAPPPINSKPTSLEEALRNGSNYDTWKEWKSKNTTSLQRLVDPGCDLPADFNVTDAPQIIFRLNKGDPLFEDGQNLVTALNNAKFNVTSLEDKGLHCSMGGVHDKAGYDRVMSHWSNVVFASND